VNRPLPARDRDHRSRDSVRQSGSPRALLGTDGLGRGIAAIAGGVGSTKKPPEPSPGGGKERGRGRSGLERIGALPFLSLDGFYTETHLLAERAADEAADTVGLPPRCLHNLGQRRAALAFQQSHHGGGLATLADALRLSGLGFFWRLGWLFGGVAFLVALAFAGAPLATRAPRFGFRSAFGFFGSASGLTASPNPWTCAQMRQAAALALLNPFTGSTPGRLFQTATKRSAGQGRQFCQFLSLVKAWASAPTAASAWSGVGKAVMLLSVSIVNVVIIVLLGATLCAVITWITPVADTSKAILFVIEKAMEKRWASAPPHDYR
jgi:hypothetical protein